MSDALEIGDRIKDNDPRMGSRYLRVIEVLPNGVRAEHPISGRVFLILRRRIYTDGKPRKSGFSRIQP
jgi:hypothetical protein